MKYPEPKLEWLLDYELRASTRHRRFLSLVMVSNGNNLFDIGGFLSDSLRDSDRRFPTRDGVAIVMGDTEYDGAQTAVNRYRSKCGDKVELRCGIAAFPQDGHSALGLIQTARERLGAAKERKRDALAST